LPDVTTFDEALCRVVFPAVQPRSDIIVPDPNRGDNYVLVIATGLRRRSLRSRPNTAWSVGNRSRACWRLFCSRGQCRPKPGVSRSIPNRG